MLPRSNVRFSHIALDLECRDRLPARPTSRLDRERGIELPLHRLAGFEAVEIDREAVALKEDDKDEGA
jgi:hypothetical protein